MTFVERTLALGARLLPPIGDLAVRRVLHGVYDTTPDRRAILGPAPGFDGLFVAAGFIGGKWPISVDGGREPVWSKDGRELFYRAGDRIMAVSVSTTPTFRAEKPRPLFEGRCYRQREAMNWDVSSDGQRFVMIQEEEERTATQLSVALNWFDELKARGFLFK